VVDFYVLNFGGQYVIINSNFDQLTLPTAQDYGEAEYYLGVCYLYGQGTKRNVELALQYFEKSANRGCASGLNGPAVCSHYGQGGVSKDHAIYYTLSAEQGFAKALRNLGVCYQNGNGVTQDYAKAIHYYQLAAEQEDDHALNSLGICYQHGYGVEKDLIKMAEYYKKSAELGNAQAQYSIACCHVDGVGMDTKSPELVIEYMKLATDQGYAPAQYNLGSGYHEGYGSLPKDFTSGQVI
jgi:TPR repeat protein